jgi:hypothetical protein
MVFPKGRSDFTAFLSRPDHPNQATAAAANLMRTRSLPNDPAFRAVSS